MPPVKPLPELWIAWHHFQLCLISHWGEANVCLKGANKFWQSPPNSRMCGTFRNGGRIRSTLAKNSSERLCTHKPFRWFSNGWFITLLLKHHCVVREVLPGETAVVVHTVAMCGHAFGESPDEAACARLWLCVCIDKQRLVSQCLQGAVVLSPRLILIPFQTLARAVLNPRPNRDLFPAELKMRRWLDGLRQAVVWSMFRKPPVCQLYGWGFEWLCLCVCWQEMVCPCGEG